MKCALHCTAGAVGRRREVAAAAGAAGGAARAARRQVRRARQPPARAHQLLQARARLMGLVVLGLAACLAAHVRLISTC